MPEKTSLECRVLLGKDINRKGARGSIFGNTESHGKHPFFSEKESEPTNSLYASLRKTKEIGFSHQDTCRSSSDSGTTEFSEALSARPLTMKLYGDRG